MKNNNTSSENKDGYYLSNKQNIDIDKLKIEAGWIGRVIGTKNPEMCTLAIALCIILVIVLIFAFYGRFDAIERLILPGIFWTVGFLAGFYVKGKKE